MTSYPCNKYEQITPSYLLSVNQIVDSLERSSTSTSPENIHTFAEYKTEEVRGDLHHLYEIGLSNMDKFYIVGKGIYQRLRLHLDI